VLAPHLSSGLGTSHRGDWEITVLRGATSRPSTNCSISRSGSMDWPMDDARKDLMVDLLVDVTSVVSRTKPPFHDPLTAVR